MAETVTFRTARLETGQLIIDIPYDQRGTLMQWLKSKKDRDYDLTIKEHREKRSLDANAYAWVLMGKLAAAMHIKPVEVYRQQIVGVGDNFTPMCVREKDVKRPEIFPKRSKKRLQSGTAMMVVRAASTAEDLPLGGLRGLTRTLFPEHKVD